MFYVFSTTLKHDTNHTASNPERDGAAGGGGLDGSHSSVESFILFSGQVINANHSLEKWDILHELSRQFSTVFHRYEGGGGISFQNPKMLGITLLGQAFSFLETCHILPWGKQLNHYFCCWLFFKTYLIITNLNNYSWPVLFPLYP